MINFVYLSYFQNKILNHVLMNSFVYMPLFLSIIMLSFISGETFHSYLACGFLSHLGGYFFPNFPLENVETFTFFTNCVSCQALLECVKQKERLAYYKFKTISFKSALDISDVIMSVWLIRFPHQCKHSLSFQISDLPSSSIQQINSSLSHRKSERTLFSSLHSKSKIIVTHCMLFLSGYRRYFLPNV